MFCSLILAKNRLLNIRKSIFHEMKGRDLIYFIWKNLSNLRDCNFHDFDTLANIAENGCTRKKPDIRYFKNMGMYVLFKLDPCAFVYTKMKNLNAQTGIVR